jgi:hypothetical protein
VSEYVGRCMGMRTDDTLISGMTARRPPGTDHCGRSTVAPRRAGSPHGTPPRRAFSPTFCFADRDAAHRYNPDPDPGARVRLAQSAPPGPATGKLAAQGPGSCPIWEQNGSGDPAPDAVRSRQTRRVGAMSTRLTCGNAPEQGFCKHSRSVRDEEAAGSNPATPTQVTGQIRSLELACDGPKHDYDGPKHD